MFVIPAKAGNEISEANPVSMRHSGLEACLAALGGRFRRHGYLEMFNYEMI
jgi:hypothetical protein